jgi:hypothetical protein
MGMIEVLGAVGLVSMFAKKFGEHKRAEQSRPRHADDGCQ